MEELQEFVSITMGEGTCSVLRTEERTNYLADEKELVAIDKEVSEEKVLISKEAIAQEEFKEAVKVTEEKVESVAYSEKLDVAQAEACALLMEEKIRELKLAGVPSSCTCLASGPVKEEVNDPLVKPIEESFEKEVVSKERESEITQISEKQTLLEKASSP